MALTMIAPAQVPFPPGGPPGMWTPDSWDPRNWEISDPAVTPGDATGAIRWSGWGIVNGQPTPTPRDLTLLQHWSIMSAAPAVNDTSQVRTVTSDVSGTVKLRVRWQNPIHPAPAKAIFMIRSNVSFFGGEDGLGSASNGLGHPQVDYPGGGSSSGEKIIEVSLTGGVGEFTVTGSASASYFGPGPSWPLNIHTTHAATSFKKPSLAVTNRAVGLFFDAEPTFENHLGYETNDIKNRFFEDRRMNTAYEIPVLPFISPYVELPITARTPGRWGRPRTLAWSLDGGGSNVMQRDSEWQVVKENLRFEASRATVQGMRRGGPQMKTVTVTGTDPAGSRTGTMKIKIYPPAHFQHSSTRFEMGPWSDVVVNNNVLGWTFRDTDPLASGLQPNTYTVAYEESESTTWSVEVSRSLGSSVSVGLKGFLDIGVQEDFGVAVGASYTKGAGASYPVLLGVATQPGERWKVVKRVGKTIYGRYYDRYGHTGYEGGLLEDVRPEAPFLDIKGEYVGVIQG